MKTVPLTISPKTGAANADEWVQGGRSRPAAASELTKRFTIDVPLELHRRIKTQCAMQGRKMADALREILEREFPKS